MLLKDFDGVIGKEFRIGYGKNFATLTVNDDKSLTLNVSLKCNGVDAGKGAIKTTYLAKSDEDVANLVAVKNAVNDCAAAMRRYTDGKIKEITGGTSGTNIMLAPTDISVDNLIDGYTVTLGKLAANKFIDRVIFEVDEAFALADEYTSYDFSIGTATAPEFFVPKFSIDKLSTTFVIQVEKTLRAETEFIFYAYRKDLTPPPPPEPPFEQKIFNAHSSVSSSMTSDASKKVWSIDLTGADQVGNIVNTEDFPGITGDYLDFGINLPLTKNHRYRIMQTNPALAAYPDDPNISNVEGVWTKDREYAIADEPEIVYNFILTGKNGDNDYAHIYVYDLESETPEEAILTYHIHNNIVFKADAVEPAPNALQYDFLSADEGEIGVIQNANDDYTITLSGSVHSRAAELDFPGIQGNLTKLGVFYPYAVPQDGLRVAIYNPAYADLSEDPSVKSTNGVFYTDITVTDPDESTGIWLDIPISTKKDYPIVVVVLDLATKRSFLIGIDNELTILDAPVAPEPEVPALMTAFNLEAEPVELTAGGNSGKAKLRILSF